MSTWTGAVSTDWNNAGNWGPGGTGTGIPSATVDAIFSGTPTRPCVLGANRACRALTFTAYTSTVDFGIFSLTTSNNITFQADQSSRILGSTGILISGTSQTITSNLGTWPLNYSIANVASIVITLVGDMRVTGSYSATNGSRTLNGNILYIGGNVTITATHGGTTNLVMNGSGTYSGGNTWNLEINTTGSIVITGNVSFTRRFIITAVGSITMSAANVGIENTTTVDLGGRTIGNLSHTFNAGGSAIFTYLTDVICANLSLSNGATTCNGPGKIFAFGNFTFSAGNASGSLVVELKGTGTISTGTMGLVTILNSSGTYTLGATLQISNNFTCQTLTLNTATSTITITNGVVLNTLGINWYNITIPTGATITINQLLSISNNLNLSGTNTFAGTAGWTCANLLNSTAPSTITLANSSSGASYRTTTTASLLGTNAQRITMTSNNATTQSIWTLDNGANQLLVYVNGTRVNSAQGATIWSFGGTLTGTTNWGTGSAQATTTYTYVC